MDIVIGVADARSAFAVDTVLLTKMDKVFKRELDSGELGSNPIDSMQRAFDLFTRPPMHMKTLVDLDRRVKEAGILENDDTNVLLQRLRLAYWVAEARSPPPPTPFAACPCTFLLSSSALPVTFSVNVARSTGLHTANMC